jgi:mycofactocin system glycosyltransferase
VSIIVPVYNREKELGECLDSLAALVYPADKIEVIVVDDASTDRSASIAAQHKARLVRLPVNRGQSAARNEGVKHASGELIAFIDSDCIADAAWLHDLVPYFQDSRTALVGGYVASFFQNTWLDRYEEVKSPLCMGSELAIGAGSDSDFYVPTCNMVVRKGVYHRVGGLNENQRVGEDVDLCWRLKEAGFRLMYVPKGIVKHKHRSSFSATFSRRFQYGTSEPLLHEKHPHVSKRYPWNPASMVILAGCIGALALQSVLAALLVPGTVLLDTWAKKRRYELQIGVPISMKEILRSTAGTHFELLFHLTYHWVRYYLILMLLVGAVFPSLAPAAMAVILFPSFVEFRRKRPRLSYPAFVFFFASDHISYQAGVLWGSIVRRNFRSYKLRFVTVGRRERPSIRAMNEVDRNRHRSQPLGGRDRTNVVTAGSGSLGGLRPSSLP